LNPQPNFRNRRMPNGTSGGVGGSEVQTRSLPDRAPFLKQLRIDAFWRSRSNPSMIRFFVCRQSSKKHFQQRRKFQIYRHTKKYF
ncbi:MAG: hypothetical protein KH632_07200, partial [Sutterella wadsworthensis]|nr:hypothetical protein [Sutterella wadsworthensis]